MKNVGFIGWRGMVGSVLIKRMLKKKDFNNINAIFFSTSQYGESVPDLNIKNKNQKLENAYNFEKLFELDIIVTCQGSEYTNEVYFKLRKIGWNGYWIDAASNLRTSDNAVIVLDPINLKNIQEKLNMGVKTFVGGNCTVSLMLMALGGLFENNLIDWISVSTYQAASGAGAKFIKELILQIKYISNIIPNLINDKSNNILNIEKKITENMNSSNFPKKNFHTSLINNLIPWIDKKINNSGQTKEEWKGQYETNKILNKTKKIPIDGICVRIATLRSHSQSFTIKLNQNLSIDNIHYIINSHNKWVKVIPNDFNDTINFLTPSFVSRKLDVVVGRIKKLNIDKNCFSIFSVGDQLLWGASEPLRRMLKLLI
ncbi:aspartate-semialdehyde dehydrogenase [Enterobacteriaceae endosymbiont of Donacia bicoloricornis]|uniref:aspartate-semialdehyde dehydrogenase n=1 Tax=Enterobacteriaceae endosymbiont of Donacia bicoloricornis TaxID=2675772 RepID=UPI00144942E8|nr:aspartate-semialdehyde dehydrogenase [Enterobacteriaceae endosymbiont of Donacia bicoloricornis]QJC37845.1 aspartate-semialdehyde dehydrogenase [Enterobacteriaceae endosymbiont of Donacia bicoloricornis]